MPPFLELNADQAREVINTAQRYAVWREAKAQAAGYRGSMVWSTVKGQDYLIRAGYDKGGKRKQKSLGPRDADRERIKQEFDEGRAQADARLNQIEAVLHRQSAINRALRLGRVPELASRIIRSLDEAGWLGNGLRVLGTYALFAYEAAAGVQLEPELTTTEDIDLLLDARNGVSFAASDEIEETSLLALLKRVDRSFDRTAQTFRAANQDGFLVDLIKPMRSPPWKADQSTLGGGLMDLDSAEIEGLVWHESAPAFEAMCIDSRGAPLRLVTSDPRVFAIHKQWLSKRPDRAVFKQRRDTQQARATVALIRQHMPHLPLDRAELKMLPKAIVDDALDQLDNALDPMRRSQIPTTPFG
jgi:hypothetical protein